MLYFSYQNIFLLKISCLFVLRTLRQVPCSLAVSYNIAATINAPFLSHSEGCFAPFQENFALHVAHSN